MIGRSFVQRLMLWFGGTSILVMLSAMGVAWVVTSVQAVQDLESKGDALARHLASRVRSQLRIAETVPRVMAVGLTSRGFDSPDQFESWLRAILVECPTLHGLTVLYAEGRSPVGRRMFGGHVESRGARRVFLPMGDGAVDYAQVPWFRRALAMGQVVWHGPEQGLGDGRVLTCAVPFRGDDGRMRGVVAADVAEADLEEVTRDQGRLHGGYVLILDNGGRLVLSPGAMRAGSEARRGIPHSLVTAIRKGGRGFRIESDPLHGTRSWVFSADVQRPPLITALVIPEREALRDAWSLEQFILGMGLVYTVALVILARVIAGMVTRPLDMLVRMARHLSSGDLYVTRPLIEPGDEMSELRTAFNKVLADLKASMRRLQEATRAREHMARELVIAAQIQRQFLPEHFPESTGGAASFEVYARCEEAQEVGGDFYDFFLLAPKRLGFCLGDASGKGIPAAIFMAVARTLVRAYATRTDSPAACLSDVNRRLCEENEAPMFITLFYGVLDLDSGRLTWCNAGHLPPFHLHSAGLCQITKSQGNPPLGVLDEAAFVEECFHLDAGDALVLYSDGVTEARNPYRELYGEERLEPWLQQHSELPPRALLDTLHLEMQSFASGARQADDMTTMVVRYVGKIDGERICTL